MKKVLKIGIPLLLAVLIVAGAAWYLKNYQSALLAKFYINRGDAAMSSERYERAARFYQRAWNIDDTDAQLAVDLAGAYKMAENYTKAEYTLVNAISDMPEEIDLYLALSSTYVEQDKLLDASQMLDNISNETVKQRLSELRPDAPILSPESGYYTEYISVSLTNTTGTCYLSTDGAFPTLSGGAYTEPVQLGAGEAKAVAVTVGENDLVSSATYGAYTIGGVVEEVTLQDGALDAYVRQLLNLGQDDVIMTNDLWSIQKLQVPQEVTSLADLKNFTGLTSLTIHNFSGDDFSFLSNLSQLERIDFAGSTVTSQTVALIGQQKNLKWLSLNGCGVSNLSGLSGCTALEYLDLTNDQVADVSPLAGCQNLSGLYLSGNAITSLEAMGSLSGLEELDLSYNAVQNLGALSKCTKLSELDLSSCSLVDISAVGDFPSLTSLKAASNSLEDISGLEKCTQLEHVNLSNNKLTSIDTLGSVDSLKEININYNDVVNAPQFSANSQLEKFYADHNFMEGLSGLANCTNLNYVTLDYNNIANIDALANCVNLVQVNVFGTNIHSAASVQTLLDHGIIVNYTPA